MPRPLNLLYIAMGVDFLFVYLFPVNEGLATMLGVVISIWQGVLFLKAKPTT